MIKRLKELRNDKQLNQKQIAALLNITQQTYSDYETGRTNPDIDTLLHLSKILECSIDYLLGNSDDFGNITFKKEKSSTDNFSAEEIKLIEDYRSLQPALKEMIQATIQTWKKSSINNKKNKKYNNLP